MAALSGEICVIQDFGDGVPVSVFHAPERETSSGAHHIKTQQRRAGRHGRESSATVKIHEVGSSVIRFLR
jgi:hypothetical protein